MLTFFKGVFSESDGTPSFSRLFTGLVVAFSMGWVTSIVKATHALPDFLSLSLLIGTLYGLNKGSGVLETWLAKGKQ
jgi:hypothetical protein